MLTLIIRQNQAIPSTCLQVDLITPIALDGALFYQGTDQRLWRIDSTGESAPIHDPQLLWEYAVHPDQTKLAVISQDSDQGRAIDLFDVTGRWLDQVRWADEWTNFTGVLADGRLVVQHYPAETGQDRLFFIPIPPPEGVSPATETFQGFVDVWPISEMNARMAVPRMIVNATGTHVLYSANRYLILAEVATQTILWRGPSHRLFNDYFSFPVWSPDGEQWIASSQDGILLGDLTGERALIPMPDQLKAHYFAWSSDMTQIAFWARSALGPADLYTLQLDSGTLEARCLRGLPTPISWSADRAVFAFSASDALVLIDSDQGRYQTLRIPAALRLLAWLREE
jgi:hypothetical protein